MRMVTRLPLGQVLLSPMKNFLASASGRSSTVLVLFTMTATSSPAAAALRSGSALPAMRTAANNKNEARLITGFSSSSESEVKLPAPAIGRQFAAHRLAIELQFEG